MEQDEKILEIHMQDKRDLETKQVAVEEKSEEVESKKATLETQKDELVALKETLDTQKDEQDSLIAQLETEYEELTEYKLSIEEEEELLAAEEEALEKARQDATERKGELEQLAKKREEEERERKRQEAIAREKEQKKQEALKAEAAQETNDNSPENESNENSGSGNKPANTSSVPNSDSGSFIWPAQGRISSEYGYRNHPIYNTPKLHAGIDIANGTGTDVIATAPGVVISGNYKGGYGNAIFIAHSINGQSYTTVYAHLSSISVTAGQVVNQGESIGKMGSTGDSTGPHLHFEIYVGGFDKSRNNTVNPRNYLPK